MGANITLRDGREIEIDLYKVTRKEFREFVNPRGKLETEDVFVSKVTGLTLDEVANLPEPEFRRLVREIVKAIREPLSDPN